MLKGLIMASSSSHDGVPTWNGDAASFETFVVACRWYEKSLKEYERL